MVYRYAKSLGQPLGDVSAQFVSVDQECQELGIEELKICQDIMFRSLSTIVENKS